MTLDDRPPLDYRRRGQDRHALPHVKGNRAVDDIPERRAPILPPPEEPFPTVVVREGAQRLHPNRDRGESHPPPAEQLHALGQE